MELYSNNIFTWYLLPHSMQLWDDLPSVLFLNLGPFLLYATWCSSGLLTSYCFLLDQLYQMIIIKFLDCFYFLGNVTVSKQLHELDVCLYLDFKVVQKFSSVFHVRNASAVLLGFNHRPCLFHALILEVQVRLLIRVLETLNPLIGVYCYVLSYPVSSSLSNNAHVLLVFSSLTLAPFS